MDIYKNLILIKNSQTKEFEDRTAEISHLVYAGNEVAITYLSSDKTYNYKSFNVRFFKVSKMINCDSVIVCIDEFPVGDCTAVIDFGDYVKIIDHSQRASTYCKSRVTFQNSCLNAKQPKAVFGYLKELSSYLNIMDDGRALLFEQYEKLKKVNENSILSTYLSGSPIAKNKNEEILLFPFGLNLSQKEAVKRALENSISIIEGPPGTGKTQTILNIIANIISKGKTVGVVSGNNSATSNVQEKLTKNGYGFITALLGNVDKKADFFDNKQSDLVNCTSWAQEAEQRQALSDRLQRISQSLDILLEDQNKLAKLQEELSKLEVEQTYFENNFKDEYIPVSKFSFRKKWSNDSMLAFIHHLERIILKKQNEKLTTKAFLIIKYGILKSKFLIENQGDIISSLKRDYYKNGIEKREKQIATIRKRLESKSFEKLMEQYKDTSSKLFKANLLKRYLKKARGNYTAKNFRYKFQDFICDYPVVLSTTHSIINSISENYLFDYLIIDEASQVDLVTAALALSCCKNVIIVGDVKQLPQIVSSEIEKRSDEIFYKNNLKEAYNYTKYSIIASLMKLYEEELPRTLLCEHYRCHPKIIGFCNEKFYENQLVIMTEENPEDKPLRIYKTTPGNHARKDQIGDEKGWYNLRQIEVIRDEIIGQNYDKYGDIDNIGIISPYRKHVTETKKYIRKPELEIDTVHKFQGREKETIIFTTVANDITPFVDDANLINVAVSRAIKEIIIVTSNRLFKQHGTNIGDLMRYIEYNSLENAIVESSKISVFDLLYSEHSDKLLKFMNSAKHVSEYKSENIMYKIIEEAISYPEFNSFKVVIHIPLNSIIRDFSYCTDEEKAFAKNPWTHVDFLIFNKLDKEPVLVVEVDGHRYHRNNEKQLQRDALKDRILASINLPILRITTNESGEKEKLKIKLEEIVKRSASS